MELRNLTEQDLELVCRHRAEMFRDAGCAEATLDTMTAHFRTWLRPRLSDGSYFGFVLSDGNALVGGIGLMLIDWPPHPLHPALDKRGYVLNVYIEPDYRKRGLARELMRHAESELARRGVTLAILHATEKGRGLYGQLGWQGTSEMSKDISG